MNQEAREVATRKRMAANKIRLHIFIQWLANEGLFNDWLDEMMYERNGFSIESRASRLQSTNNQREMCYSSFGITNSMKGRTFWVSVDKRWKVVYEKLLNVM